MASAGLRSGRPAAQTLRLEWTGSTSIRQGQAAMSAGIHAFGGYVPRLRLQRRVIAEANAWFNPALRTLGRGERAIASWDEDSITMAVEAARDCLAGYGRNGVAQVLLASTTLPFQDRQNAGVVAEALRLAGAVGTLDVAGSQRAGTSALIAACQVARGGGGPVLVTSAEKRRTKAASPLELTTGDAAAALLVGEGDGVAKLLGHATFSTDFVDHYRGQDERFDYVWEERWVRDEGFLKIVPEAVGGALGAAGLDAGAIDHFCFPSPMRRAGPGVAKLLGLAERTVRDNLQGSCRRGGRGPSTGDARPRAGGRGAGRADSRGRVRAGAAMRSCSRPPARSRRRNRSGGFPGISGAGARTATTTATSASTTWSPWSTDCGRRQTARPA